MKFYTNQHRYYCPTICVALAQGSRRGYIPDKILSGPREIRLLQHARFLRLTRAWAFHLRSVNLRKQRVDCILQHDCLANAALSRRF